MSQYFLEIKRTRGAPQYVSASGDLTTKLEDAYQLWGLEDVIKAVHLGKVFGAEQLARLDAYAPYRHARVSVSQAVARKLVPVKCIKTKQDDGEPPSLAAEPLSADMRTQLNELTAKLAPCLTGEEYTIPSYFYDTLSQMALTPRQGSLCKLATVYCPAEVTPNKLLGGSVLSSWRNTATISQVFALTGALAALQPDPVPGFSAYVVALNADREESILKSR